ncbi:fatty-acid--AMP ligase FAAL30/FadD30, partial [Escherichia coli]|nr:fatty-acid--AMP ligase FAAL30/FadD30 [Escherichia coli]
THGASVTTPVIALDTLDEPSGDNCDLDSQLSDWSSYLQYTSGSTANPRGVVLSMRNVTENVDQIIRNYFRHEGGAPRLPSLVVSWFPLYHDMGLMVGLFIPLFVGCPVILTSPEAFIRKPARWMQLLAKHQAPFSAAPNFAFDLAVAKTSEEDMA